MLPDYITAYLHRHTPEYRRHLLDDPQTTFEQLMLDALCPVEIAMLIEDENPGTEIADEVYEAWQTLADVAETARAFEGVGGGMKILIACEYSGTVRRAFTTLGHDAWSCDLLPAEDGSNRHYRGDVRQILQDGWDMLIVAHPPCTRLCNSGVRWLTTPPPGKTAEQMWAELDEGADLFSTLWNAPVPRVACENPVMHRHAKERIVNFRPAAQSVQPWQYGDWETKRTCLWLRGLPPLVPTYTTLGHARQAMGLPDDAMPTARVHRMPPGADRAKERSRFFAGIASAMADQWGGLLDVRAAA